MNAPHPTTVRRRRMRALLPFALLLLGTEPVGAGDGAASPAPEPRAVAESSATFESRGKPIAAERFEPAEPGRYPVVVVLHGSGGLAVGGFMFRGLARELAARGYVVVLPHYFDRTGTRIADPKAILDRFAEWMETVADATTYAAALPNADAERIGLVGFSLGGYLATSSAAYDPRVKAVVEYFGGLPDLLADRAGRLPPTLILHGDADAIVPVSEARELEDRLKAHDIPCEVHIYEGANHGFLGATGRDASRRTVEFLGKHLGR